MRESTIGAQDKVILFWLIFQECLVNAVHVCAEFLVSPISTDLLLLRVSVSGLWCQEILYCVAK